MAMPRAVFSTNLGQHPPRPLEDPLPPTIARSNPDLDTHVFGMALRNRWPPVCKLINHLFDVSDYFDDLDVHVQGKEFLWAVLKQLAYENTVRRERVTMFAMDWSRTNVDRFEALEQETEMVGFFTDEETEGVGGEWLFDVFIRLKYLKLENRGQRENGACARNMHRRYDKTPHPANSHRSLLQPYVYAQMTSPQQFQPFSVTSPVYTPSMISSGSWSDYQTPTGHSQDGCQWGSVHGSPQPPAYRVVDTHFGQFSPPSGVWDMRGPLPSPRFPPDLSQNAFGDPLHNHGSVAARRSRAPPHLRLDIGNARFDGVQHHAPTPSSPFTAASLTRDGHCHNVGPSLAFGGAGPMHNLQLHPHHMSQNRDTSGKARPNNNYPTPHVENNGPVFPQSSRPNPVVDIRDPSYIPGDVRLLEPGPGFYDRRHSNINRSKFRAKHTFVERDFEGSELP